MTRLPGYIISSYLQLPRTVLHTCQIYSDITHEWIKSQEESPIEILNSFQFPILCHSATPFSTKDPVFMYANPKALDVFGYSLEEILNMPSHLSAETDQRQERLLMLKEAEEKGYIMNYKGIRIRKDGSKFQIKDALIWNVFDENHLVIGQAALLPRFSSYN